MVKEKGEEGKEVRRDLRSARKEQQNRKKNGK
jgi:hypothetical protein